MTDSGTFRLCNGFTRPAMKPVAAVSPTAFEQELLGAVSAVHRFALHLARDPVRAEDLVQETYLRALAHRAQYASGSAERGSSRSAATSSSKAKRAPAARSPPRTRPSPGASSPQLTPPTTGEARLSILVWDAQRPQLIRNRRELGGAT